MLILFIGLIIFFAIHAIPMVPALAGGLGRIAGEKGRKGVIALGALIGFALIVWGKAQAGHIPLWTPPPWGRTAAHILMPIAFVLLAAAYVPKNRIRRLVRNPMLAAIILWALAHLCANGDLDSLALFGGVLVFAGVDWWSTTRRPRPAGPRGGLTGDAVTVFVGLVAFIAVVTVHPYLFGASAA
jgi:uncharacterized membrane protein